MADSRFTWVFAAALALGTSAALFLPRSAAADADEQRERPDSEEYAVELQGFVPGAAALEGRIMAPCCWTQTIDIHGSPVANELRREIRRRLKAGEGSDAIQASLVERYGEKILAVPPGSPLKSVAAVLALGMMGAGAGGFSMLRRWRSRSQTGSPPKKPAAEGATKDEGATQDTALDAKLDAELKALDD